MLKKLSLGCCESVLGSLKTSLKSPGTEVKVNLHEVMTVINRSGHQDLLNIMAKKGKITDSRLQRRKSTPKGNLGKKLWRSRMAFMLESFTEEKTILFNIDLQI